MKDVGLAQLKEMDIETGIDLDHPDGLDVAAWSLVEAWGEGEGVEEHSKIIGLEDFLRTEHALAEPRTVEQIDSVHLVQGLLGDRHAEHETFQYSVKETGKEQHNPEHAHVDGNLVTDIGRLKRGTGDPDAAKRRDSASMRHYRIMVEMQAQERMLAELYERLAQLDEQIAQLDQRLGEIDQELAEIEEMQRLLDEGHDFNDNTAQGRRLRRGLSQSGGGDAPVTRPDGTIDSDAARRALEERERDLRVERDDTQGQRDDAQAERDTVGQRLTEEEARLGEMRDDYAQAINGSDNSGSVVQMTGLQGMGGIDLLGGARDAQPVLMFGPAEIEPEFASGADDNDLEVLAFYGDEVNSATFNTAFASTPLLMASAPLQTSTSASVANAFNAAPGESDNVITAQFTLVSDPMLAEARVVEQELAQLQAQRQLQLAEQSTADAPVQQQVAGATMRT